MKSTISVIIPAWNEADVISKTGKFLENLSLPFDYSELIYIAGGEDNTYELCKELDFSNFDKKLVLKQQKGDFKSGALIKGIKKSTADYIILLDADVFVKRNLIVEIVKALQNFDVVCCDFKPLVEYGFWYKYYLIDKLHWSNDPNNLSNLYGGATTSFKKEMIKKHGVEFLFTSNSKAGVDYYMSRALKSYNKKIGFVENTYVILPRPNNIIDFSKDQKRWLTAFFEIHRGEKRFIWSYLLLNLLICLFPPLLFFFNLKKIMKIKAKIPRLKYLSILFLVEYLINVLSLKTFLSKLTNTADPIGHFKGTDRYFFNDKNSVKF